MTHLLDTYDIWLFDCDSTLSTIEGIDELSGDLVKKSEVSQLTSQAMNGLIAFEHVVGRRLDVIRPSLNDLTRVGHHYIKTVVPGAREVIAALQMRGKEVHIVSGGYVQAILPFANYLGVPISRIHAIELTFDERGVYTGYDTSNNLAKNGGKKAVVEQLRKDGRENIVFVGDSVADLETKPIVDLFIGFGGVVKRPVVEKESNIYLTSNFFSLLGMEVAYVK